MKNNAKERIEPGIRKVYQTPITAVSKNSQSNPINTVDWKKEEVLRAFCLQEELRKRKVVQESCRGRELRENT
ncbi:hypothetical protein YC2023_072897 [Brassica napus]